MLQGSEALYAAGGAGGMFALLFVLLASGRLWTWTQVRELREDRDRWRTAAETVLPVVEDSAKVQTEMANLLRSLDTRIASQQVLREGSG